MANYTLTEDTDLSTIPGLSSGWDIGLGGHVLIISTDMRSVTGLKASGTGTIRLVSGGAADFTGFAIIPDTITIEGGTAENPLPAHRDAANIADNYPLRASAFMLIWSNTRIRARVVSHSDTNAGRVQFASIVRIPDAPSTTLTFDRDMGLEPGDVVGIVYRFSQSTDPNGQLLQVTSYDSQTNTATVATPINLIPNSGAGCVLLTSAFAIGTPAQRPTFFPESSISGGEVGVVLGSNVNSPSICCHVELERLVVAANGYQYDNGVFASNDMKCDVYVSNSGCGCSAIAGTLAYGEFIPFSYRASFGHAFCPSLFSGYYNYVGTYKQYSGNTGAGVFVGGGDVSTYPLEPYGYAEFVDCGLPNPLYENIRETTELVIRTTSPETCVINRASGVASLTHRNEQDDAAMTNAPVMDAFQFSPNTSSDDCWHDLPVTIPPWQTLNIAWYAYAFEGIVDEQQITAASSIGMQIVEDSPLFGQVAVPLDSTTVLAQKKIENPTTNVWLPIQKLFYTNASAQPKRVWVRDWAHGGMAYSKVQIISGGIA